MPVYLSEDGYSIKGIAPPDLRDRPEFALAFWQWVVDLGLRAKDNELSRGLDKNGKPLRRITEATRLHRRSAMTPTGKGDPSAPPLMPGRQLSRTRSLLTGRAYPDHAAFWWKFDPWTGDSWARTLEIQRDRWGRDVFGISPKAEAAVKTKAWAYWADLKAGRPIPVITARQATPVVIPQVGRAPTAAAVFGIGAGGRTPGPGFSGGLTRKEWEAFFRVPAKVAIPGRPGDDYNVILRHIWGSPGGPAKAVAIIPKPPRPKPPKPKPVVQRAAMGPKPTAPLKPKPVPPPPPPPKPTPVLPPKPTPSFKPAPSTATIEARSPDFAKASQKIFGRVLSDQELANLSGIAKGKLYVEVYIDTGEIAIRGDTKEYTVHRSLKRATVFGDEVILKANSFYVKKQYQGKGIGADVFGRMVAQAEKSGIDTISTHAARSDIENGYYTWAKFGYDGPLPDRIRAKLPASLASARQVSDLMITPEGSAWWMTHGESIYLSFNPKPGSKSRQIWDAYQAAKAKATASNMPTSPKPTLPLLTGPGKVSASVSAAETIKAATPVADALRQGKAYEAEFGPRAGLRGYAEESYKLQVKDLDPRTFDPDREFEIIRATTSRVRQIVRERPKFVRAVDRDGASMVEHKDEPIGQNHYFTNDPERVGWGVGGRGGLKSYRFPYTQADKSAIPEGQRTALETDPIFLQVHELHHAFNSHTEFDQWSPTVAVDVHLALGNQFNPDAVESEIDRMLTWAQRAPRGDMADSIRRARAGIGFLYDRHPEAVTKAIDMWNDKDKIRKKVQSWAKEINEPTQ